MSDTAPQGYEILMAIRGDIGELKALTHFTQKTLTEHAVENRNLIARVGALEVGVLANKEAAEVVRAAAQTAAAAVLLANREAATVVETAAKIAIATALNANEKAAGVVKAAAQTATAVALHA